MSSVRSNSSGIVEDINREFRETGLRLGNLSKEVGDNTMHQDSISASMKNDENTSHRSGSISSDKSNKRMMKSNKAL